MAGRKSKEELEKLKSLARDLYFNTDYTQKQIGEIVGISEQSLSKWADEGKWADLKAMEKASRTSTIKRIHEKLLRLAENDDEKSADAASKWAAVLEKLQDKKLTVPNRINVFKEFDTWLLKRNPELAKRVSQLQYEFILEVL